MKKTIIYSLLLSTLAGPSFALEEITFVADPWPPFAVSKEGKQGISIDVAKEALKTQGYDVKVEFIPWARAIEGVKKGEYDITHEWMSEEGKKSLIFSESYAVNEVKFIKRKDDTFEYNGIESLKGLTVATIRGYAYGDDFLKNNDFKREESGDFMSNIKKLVAGRVNLTLDDEIVVKNALDSDKDMLNKIDFTKNSLSSNPLYIVCGKANTKCEKIISDFNKGFEVIKLNGEYERILSSYGLK